MILGCDLTFLPRRVVLLGARVLAVCERHEAPVAARVGVNGVGLERRFEVEVLRHETLHVCPEGLPRPEAERHLAYIVFGVDILLDILMGHVQGQHPGVSVGVKGPPCEDVDKRSNANKPIRDRRLDAMVSAGNITPQGITL